MSASPFIIGPIEENEQKKKKKKREYSPAITRFLSRHVFTFSISVFGVYYTFNNFLFVNDGEAIRVYTSERAKL